MAAELGQMFDRWQELDESRSAYHDLIVTTRDGSIAYMQKGSSDPGKSLKTGALQDTGLARVWAKVMKTEQPATVDFSFYEPAGKPLAFIGVPVFDENGDPVGALVLALGPDQINAICLAAQGMGRTG